jgi:hypothetical protein
MQGQVISGISTHFWKLSLSEGQITHVLLTRSPLEYPQVGLSARLACVKHAASVRPEPGSNSPSKTNENFYPANNKPRQKTVRIIVNQRNHHHNPKAMATGYKTN